MNDVTAAEGFWGKVDSNVNWCEQDYAVSFYIAEFWNTLSSLPMVYFGILGYIVAKNRAKMPIPTADGTPPQRRAERPLLAFFLSFRWSASDPLHFMAPCAFLLKFLTKRRWFLTAFF
eukprot:GABV01007820.1.p1 GENE.GABV01007820.1~~GABV01007820.1.p1  ORF type:complete len:118 (+),score=23.52 GABV01007820.1:58-411(+)